MPTLFTYARPLLLAVLTSLTLTSCFDHDKKCDPRPSTCGSSKTTTTTPSTGGGK